MNKDTSYYEEKKKKQRKRILEIMQEKNEATKEEIKNELGYYTQYLDVTLRTLKKEGILEEHHKKWRLAKTR